MKNFILFSIMSLSLYLTVNAQWMWQHPYPQGNELKSIQMNGSLGWTVGTFGTVMKTTNEGYNWEIIDIGTKQTLNGITFNIYNDVWIVGDNGLIKYSSDGGTTWIDYSGVTRRI